MEPLDEYGLLGEQKAAPESIDDIFSDDEFGELLGGGDEPNLFEFKHTPKELERAEADFVAQRKAGQRFLGVRTHVQESPTRTPRGEVKEFIPFKQQDLQPGNYFIHNGMLLFLESVEDWNGDGGGGADEITLGRRFISKMEPNRIYFFPVFTSRLS